VSAYTAIYKFSTNVTFNGRLQTIACEEGDTISLDDDLAVEVLIQVPGALRPEKPQPESEEPEPEPLPTVETDVVTAPGPFVEAKTRAVVAVKKPPVKKKATK